MADGPYARISVLRPHDGDTVDFEAGYIRHLEWHRQAKDPWTWYGWTIWAGERQRWFVYGTFGHSAASLDAPVAPADDERDNIFNVTAHGRFVGHGLYEFLPALSRGSGEPQPLPRAELTTVEIAIGAEHNFESAIRDDQSKLQDETLWYRMIAGGSAPRYVRLRPRATVSAILAEKSAIPEKVNSLTMRKTVEIMNLRPPMCYGLRTQDSGLRTQ